ncbi:DUF4157 domain-containing protein [Streptomyces camelliae]|uniref:DUF4157 domain-containing protein n=1 Tax=Streptomyces camelliae TaxID=3004093 RepID=A0ABY7PCW6_9ACTN|nr:DUF4157 domain-containing protein [Streptomyces sp. HUAS 2-6]WBO68454.1 DUF4157 domain-containing protein [Streptomyces sp. HUAS 2-6]
MYDRTSSRAANRTSAATTRKAPGRAVVPAEALLALQRSAGNAAVVQMVRRSGAHGRHRHGPGEDQEQYAVQRSAVHDVLRGSGRPLGERDRTEMEARFGADFSDVRIHTDAAAQASAAEVGAAAYTSGSHIVAGAAGLDRHTLAHELTHVLQQRSGPVAGTDRGDGLRVSDPADRFEREAEATARRVLSAPASAGHALTGPHPARTGAVPGQPAGIQRVEYPDKIDDEVQRIFTQLQDGLDDYLTHYGTWSAGDYKWITRNADVADMIETLDFYLGEPDGRSKGELRTALAAGIRSDLTDTAAQTMTDTRTASRDAKNKLVLGRTGDTLRWADRQKLKAEGGDRLPLSARLGRRLNTGKWSVPVNYAFMDGGIEERAVFKILTGLGPRLETMLISGTLDANNFWDEVEKQGNSALWDTGKTADEGGPQAMLGHEILQLLRAGYRFYGRDSRYAQGSRLVAVHPDKPAVDPEDKTQPLTLP